MCVYFETIVCAYIKTVYIHTIYMSFLIKFTNKCVYCIFNLKK